MTVRIDKETGDVFGDTDEETLALIAENPRLHDPLGHRRRALRTRIRFNLHAQPCGCFRCMVMLINEPKVIPGIGGLRGAAIGEALRRDRQRRQTETEAARVEASRVLHFAPSGGNNPCEADRVRALVRITQRNFMGRKVWTHARPGDVGEVVSTDPLVVLFARSGTRCAVSPPDVELVD